MNIVKRLRDYANGLSGYAADMMVEAANEIEKLREDNFKMWTILCDTPERLREALRKIDAVKYYGPEGASMECDEMHEIARAALKEGE